MPWRKMLTYLTGSVDQELLLRHEFLAAENRILRSRIQGRLLLTDAERLCLAKIGKRLGRKGRRSLLDLTSLFRQDHEHEVFRETPRRVEQLDRDTGLVRRHEGLDRARAPLSVRVVPEVGANGQVEEIV